MKYENIHEAYVGVLKDVYHNPDYRAAPRGLPIREKVDYSFTVLNPTSEPIKTADVERNNVIADYTRKEFSLYDRVLIKHLSSLRLVSFGLSYRIQTVLSIRLMAFSCGKTTVAPRILATER